MSSGDFIANPGNILRDMRTRKKISVKDFASEIGCCRQHVYDIESSKASPSIQIVKKWIKVTEPTLAEILKLMIPNHYIEYLNKKDDS